MANDTQARQRTPEEVQREISQTRSELDHTLDEIGRRLSPQEIKERMMDSAKETVVEVGDAVQEHKMPLLLFGGMAAAAMWMHHRSQAREMEARAEQVRVIWDRVADALSERNGYGKLEAKLSDLAATIGDAASDARDRMAKLDVPKTFGDLTSVTREKIANLAEEIVPPVKRMARDAIASFDDVPTLPLLAVGLGIAAVMLASRKN